jgi:hypothetical protein
MTQNGKPKTRAPKTVRVQADDKFLSYTENRTQTEPLPYFEFQHLPKPASDPPIAPNGTAMMILSPFPARR